MRTEYKSQHQYDGGLIFRRTSDGQATVDIKLPFRVGQIVQRSDIARNPKDDTGFRAPSSYTAKVTCQASEGYNRVPVGTATVVPAQYPSPWGFDYEWSGNQMLIWEKDMSKNQNPGFNQTQALRTKILNNVQDEIVDVAMVLAEIGATASTGAGLMLRIGRSMQAIARKDMRVFEKLWNGKHPTDAAGKPLRGRYLDRFNRQASGMYLEWKYGIMPTVYDLQGITKGLDANEDGSLWGYPPLLVARAVNSSVETYEARGYVHEAGGTTPPVKYIVKDTCTHKARLDYRVESDLMRGLNRYGLGLTSVATVAWDKTPFSFVFDMVMPIAQIIKAWGAMAGVNPAGYCETWHVKRELALAATTTPNGRGGAIDVCKLDLEDELILNRTAYPSVPMPLPFIKNPVKVGNIATVLSLFTQLRPKGY